MDKTSREKVKDILKTILEKKLSSGGPEKAAMPFFQAIFTESQIATASILQSFYTSFGMSVYEQMAVAIAEGNGFKAIRQYHLLGEIDPATGALIEKLHTKLRGGEQADSIEELNLIRQSIKPGKPERHADSVVDVFAQDKAGNEYYFGITTVKPNKEGFETHKRKLLKWMALRLSQNKKSKVNVATVLPYNPSYPEPYSRFGSDTLFGDGQFLVQEEFWNLIGGEGTFEELVEVCKEVGCELRAKIDKL
jgi:hypothetical protein